MSIKTGHLKDLHGRGMNGVTEEYTLPADPPELDRLSTQHAMWRLFVGGLYPPSLDSQIRQALQSKEGKRALVLDIGCGSGIWTVEMAEAFPDADFIGIDVAQNNNSSPPPNVQFVQEDLRQGLPQFKGKADLIWCRLVVQHMADPQALVSTINDCLTPGGIVLLSDADIEIRDKDKKPLFPLTPLTTFGSDDRKQSHSWYAGLMWTWLKAAQSPTYKPVDALLQEHGCFQEVQCFDYFSPCQLGRNGDEIGRLGFINSRDLAQAVQPKMLESGFSAEMVATWDAEIAKERETFEQYTHWRIAYGLKTSLSM